MQKKNFNFVVPPEIESEIDAMSKIYGAKRKWVIITAAILTFLECSLEKQRDLIRRVMGADTWPGEIAKLIADAKSRNQNGGATIRWSEEPEPPSSGGSENVARSSKPPRRPRRAVDAPRRLAKSR